MAVIDGGQPQQIDPNGPIKQVPHGSDQTTQAGNKPFEYWLGNGNPYESPAGQWPGIDKASKQWVWAAYQSSFGRPPTSDELASALPAAQTGATNAQAFVAQAHQAQENTPDKLYSEQQKKYLADAPKYADQVKGLFQGQLGRDASQEELDHFGSLLASGTTNSYQLQQFLQQQPEYVNKQNETMRQGLGGQMAANDRRQFSEQILPSIQEAYAKQGRSFDSSSFANAATRAAQEQNTNREAFLGNLTAQQYGGVQDRAYQDYANRVANQQNLTNQGIQAQYAGIQNVQNRSNQFADLNTQAQLYNQYLSKYGKRDNGLGGLIGGLAGAGLGAYLGGPGGRIAGAQLGNNLGTSAGNIFGGGSY